MGELAVITPTRGRPDRFAELLDAIRTTAAGDVVVMSCVDEDDPTRDEYDRTSPPAPDNLRLYGPRRSLAGWTNAAALNLAGNGHARYLASLGDDHRPRTRGWDRLLIEAIEAMGGSGFAYGNDLFQGAAMPTAWVVSADVVRALGWMMLPGCEHMYVDAAVLELGRAAGRIAYRPDVVIEHVHPLAGKAPVDESYRESNSPDRYAADAAAFEAWKRDGLAGDVDRLLAVGVPG